MVPSRRAATRWEPLDLTGLLRTTVDGVCAVDATGRVALWNRSAEHIVGYTAREVLGRLCCHVFVVSAGAGAPLCYNGCHVPPPGSRWAASRRFALTTRTKSGASVRLGIDALPVHDARGEGTAVVHVFRDLAPAGEGADAGAFLSRRELQILGLIAEGVNTRTIAARLAVSPATVRNHVRNILGKLGVHSRLEAVAHAVRSRVLAELSR
jgi:PAS domain S-box-containing protein